VEKGYGYTSLEVSTSLEGGVDAWGTKVDLRGKMEDFEGLDFIGVGSDLERVLEDLLRIVDALFLVMRS
ncbi:hypothetical protein KI387_011358, partial [Taxus chinensis]